MMKFTKKRSKIAGITKVLLQKTLKKLVEITNEFEEIYGLISIF